MALHEDPRARPALARGSRRSRILALGGEGGRSVALGLLSTAIFVAFVVLAVGRSSGWPEVRRSFFDGSVFAASFGEIASAFALNVEIFAVALVIAVLRSLPAPVFFPLRALAVVYVDLFRGVPTILVIFVLVDSAYVAEVYRAGIESVHPSQEAASRSLGLTRAQTLRHVVLPQAVRRVVPPLLNDFIGLPKDSALVALIGPIEAFRQARIDTSASFNSTPYMGTALMFVLVTIPLARFTDWLLLRQRRRRLAGAAA